MHDIRWTDFFETGSGRYWPFIVGAVVLGILGNSASDLITSILTGLFRWMGLPIRTQLADILLLALLAFSVPGLVRAITRFSNRRTMNVPNDNTIDPQPAVIAFVSLARGDERKPFMNAVEGHIDGRENEEGRCKYVRLIASPETLPAATDYAVRIKQEHPSLNIAVASETPDFMDIEKVFATTETTIKAALQENPELRPDQLVLDVTGGSALTSVGAVLAGNKYGVRIQYIDSIVDGQFTTELARVKFKRVIFQPPNVSNHRDQQDGSTSGSHPKTPIEATVT